jgi:hypothetical protein
LAWSAADISPISSRKRVPPSASAKRPARALVAPVKAPFACPKSSLSRSASGIAAQLTETNGAVARPPCVPRAGLAEEQHGNVRVRDALDDVRHFAHRRAPADEVRQAVPLAKRALERGRLAPHAHFVEGAAKEEGDLVGLERLRRVVVRAAANRLDGGVERAVGRHDDDGPIWRQASRLREELEAVHLGHSQVRDERGERGILEHLRRLPRRGLGDRVVSALA